MPEGEDVYDLDEDYRVNLDYLRSIENNAMSDDERSLEAFANEFLRKSRY